MFNEQKNLSHFEQMLLMSKLFICAEEAGYPPSELPYIKTCIQTLINALSDYDQNRVAGFCQHDLNDLIALVKEPSVLLFFVNQQLNLHWVFGSPLTLKDEGEEILNRMRQYNAPWGKHITLTLTQMLMDPAMAYFINNKLIQFADLRSWDKASNKDIQFVYDALTFVSKNAKRIQTLIEDKTLDKASLHRYLLEQDITQPLLY